jgi:hypothetical protein
MPVQKFKAKIGTGDGVSPDFEALLEVGGGQLVITAGDQRIGAWPVTSLELDLTNRGYRMSVEGEQLLVSPIDRFTFRDAFDAERASAGTHGRRGRRRTKAVERPAIGSLPVPTKRELKKAAKLERLRQEAAVEKAKGEAREEARADAKAKRKDPSQALRRFGFRGKAPLPSVEAILEPKPEPQPEAPWEVPVEKERVEVTKNALAARFHDAPGTWKAAGGVGVAVLVVAIFFPRLIATLLLIPGLLAVMTAGLGLVDPGYTRKLPPSLTEQRLLAVGGILLGLGLLIVTFF